MVLGAKADLTFYLADRAAGEQLMARLLQEVERLEQIFSLYRNDSDLSRLNRQGWLAEPPQDLVTLLARSQRFADLTGGAFDVTVQPLWRLLAQSEQRPDRAALKQALDLIDSRAIALSPARVAFAKAGMAVTLNGIAQGYITDRVTTLLKAAGLRSVLVNLGEARALAGPPHKPAWRVGLQDPDKPEKLLEVLALNNRALATSARPAALAGSPDPDRLPNLLDPRRGRAPNRYRSLSVLADDATTADALSTGFSALPPAQIQARLAALRNVEVLLFPNGGGRRHLVSAS